MPDFERALRRYVRLVKACNSGEVVADAQGRLYRLLGQVPVHVRPEWHQGASYAYATPLDDPDARVELWFDSIRLLSPLEMLALQADPQ